MGITIEFPPSLEGGLIEVHTYAGHLPGHHRGFRPRLRAASLKCRIPFAGRQARCGFPPSLEGGLIEVDRPTMRLPGMYEFPPSLEGGLIEVASNSSGVAVRGSFPPSLEGGLIEVRRFPGSPFPADRVSALA